jgi:hypothetical protein
MFLRDRLGFALGLVLLATKAARTEPPQIVLSRIEPAPVIDGSLAEAFWEKAAVTAAFVSARTGQSVEPATMARAALAADALCVGFICAGDIQDERLTIEIWPRAAFARTPAAAGQDKPDNAARPTPADPIRIEVSAEAAVSVSGAAVKPVAAVQRLPGGATVEVRIPFRDLLPKDLQPRPGDLWAANLNRVRGEDVALWSPPADGAPAPGLWVLDRSNLLENGGTEAWDLGTPVGWRIETVAEGQSRPTPAVRDTDFAIEGQAACRVAYRGRLELRPSRRVEVRRGAWYRLSAVLLVQPSPDTQAKCSLSAAPSKTGEFDAPLELTRVDMPFQASDDHVEPALVVMGPAGVVVVDDFRLEMTLP